jgi:hypothetical protein
VQGGSWHNAAPKLLASSVFGDMISTSALPRNWGGQNLLDDVVMTTQTRLLPNMVKVGATLTTTEAFESHSLLFSYLGPDTSQLQH